MSDDDTRLRRKNISLAVLLAVLAAAVYVTFFALKAMGPR
jgi:uncharacterized membrane protein (DUF485 family)